jgi:hypothetical protein
MMDDKALLDELQEKAMGLGLDVRFLINELIKRYKARSFELKVLSGKSVFGSRYGELAGYDEEELICVAELLRRNLIQKEELGTMLGDCFLMYSVVLRLTKQEIRKLENGVEGTIRFPGAAEAVQAFLDGKKNQA